MKKEILLKVITAVTMIFVLTFVFAFYGCFNKLEESSEPVEKTESEEEETKDNGETGEDSKKDEEESSEQIEEAEEEKEEEQSVADTDPGSDIVEGYVYPAILKSVDINNNAVTVEQLINEPDQAEIGNNLKLAPDYTVRRIVVIRNGGEKEYSKDITLAEVVMNSEVGIIFKNDMVSAIIYSFLLDASAPLDIAEIDPLNGEYMTAALLKSVNASGDSITVEQLINEPNEKIIDSHVKLLNDCKIYKNILIRTDEGEKEYTAEISINDIPLNTEIGIGFTKDNLAKMIISQEWFED